MRLLLTGGTGYCGRPLTAALVSSGCAVRALVRSGAVELPGAEISLCRDIADPIDWTPLLEGTDAIVHLAGLTYRPDIPEERFDAVNHRATARLAAAACAAGVPLVFISSLSVQSGSTAEHELTEVDDPRPVNAYGRSKLAAERAIAASGVEFTIFRPVIIYGNVPYGYLASLAKLAKLPLPLPFGGFRNRRSLLSVNNLASAILFALRTKAARGGVYLLADPEPVTIPEIVAAYRHGLGRRPGIFHVPAAPVRWVARMVAGGGTAAATGQGTELVVSVRKLVTAGWTPVTDTRTELARMMEAGWRRAG
jgi:UDP-glucose 4-epimerase